MPMSIDECLIQLPTHSTCSWDISEGYQVHALKI